MKKIILFLFTAVFGFPILSPTALVETELSYKIRNERGVHSFGTYHNGAAQVNLVNGNLMLKRPIFERPGAAGFDLDLSLYYNSKIWDRDATQMYARWSSGSLGVGWRFPSLKTGTSTYSIYYPDGSSHELQPYDDGTWRSIDSTYIVYDPSTNTATFSDGSKLKFQTMGCTHTDRNGNKITAYNDAYGRLSYARDTTGVAARFFYTTEGMLDYVLVYGKTYAKIEFYYEDAYLGPVYPPRFSLPVQTKTGRKFLKLITTRLPDRFLEERFSYFPGTGELYKIEKGVFYGSMERFDTIATFDYNTISFADPTYTTAEERVVTSMYEYSGTTSYTTSFNYTMNGNSSNPSRTKVTDIRGVTLYNFFSSVYPARSWKDGLVSNVQRQNSSQTVTYRTQTADWEQDIPGAIYIVNPRQISP